MSLAYLVTRYSIPTVEPLYYSRIEDAAPPRARWRTSRRGWIRAPNGQMVIDIRNTGRHLLVYTRSRVYYLRRNKLRLWRIL